MVFQERVNNLLNENGTGMNITDEQRQKLLAVNSATNTDVYEGIGTSISGVTVASALATAQTLTQQTNTDIFADKIQLATTGDSIIDIPCAASKASNIATSDIKEGTVYKLMAQMVIVQAAGTHANAAIRNDAIQPFAAKRQTDVTSIVKKCSMKDLFLSGTVFPEDINTPDDLNAFAQIEHMYKASMLAEFIGNAAKMELNDDAKLTIYRCASRALAEQVFDTVWKEHYPLYDPTDASQLTDYIEAKKAYRGTLSTIGNQYMSTASATFGMQIRKLSIAPNPKWSSANKIGHVKSFGPGKSYYVGQNIDSGIMTVPVTSSMLQSHLHDMITLSVAACNLIEREVLLENGYSASHIEIPDFRSIKIDRSLLGRGYYEILGINQAEENNIYSKLNAAFTEKAENVVKAVANRNNMENAAALQQLLGKTN
jgi:hypothetical protein